MSANERNLGLALAAQIALERRIAAARTDYNAFAEFALRDHTGEPITQGVLHRVWQVHIAACWDAGKHPAILAPFAHGKTIQLTVGFACFMLGMDRNLRIKIVCQSDDKAMERVMGISTVLQSPAYKLVFPHVRPVPKAKAQALGKQSKWTQHEIYLDRAGFAIDPSVQAAGVLSAGTGGRADMIIFDDIVDQKNAIDEPKLRDKVAANFDNVWMQRLEPHGRVLYVGTPWHQADNTHRIMDKPAWCVLRQWVSEDFRVLDQEVYNPPAEYPLPVAAQAAPSRIKTVKVDGSSNVAEFSYDPLRHQLDVTFHNGQTYRYIEVPVQVYEALYIAPSKGKFLASQVKGRFAYQRVTQQDTMDALRAGVRALTNGTP
jgi:hypothetical protein